MKTLCVSVLVLLIAITTTNAAPTIIIDIGTPASEGQVVFPLDEWGPVEPTTTGGTWGGITTDPESYDGLCRTVWGPGEDNTGKTASMTFSDLIGSVDIRHLDGIADDQFTVCMDGVEWGSYSDMGSTETWKTTTFSGTPGYELTIWVTGDPWASQSTYGQVAIDRVQATVVPAPGALVLGAMGTAFVGFLRRRRAL